MRDRRWHRFYDPGVPPTILYPNITIPDLLDRAAAALPAKAALIAGESVVTFHQVRQQARRIAHALLGLGLEPGERVGFLLPNSPEYVTAYFGTLAAGLVVTNLNPRLTFSELNSLVEQAEVRTLFSTDSGSEEVLQLCEETGIARVIVVRSKESSRRAARVGLPRNWYDFDTLMRNSRGSEVTEIEVKPVDCAQIQFTGGTTGEPKGAVLTHSNLVAAAHQCFYWFHSSLPPEDTRMLLSALPFHHVYGNVVCLGMGVISRSTQLLLDRFNPDSIVEFLTRHERVGFFPAVPPMISALVDHPELKDPALNRKLGLIISGGAPLPLSLLEKTTELGLTVIEGWGMTESTSLGVVNPVRGTRKPGSIGIPMPDTDVRLMDPNSADEIAREGEAGELAIRSPVVMKGYWSKPEETADQIRQGWLYTGDIAVQDEDGYLFIVDRKKDVILTKGYNVYPREVEETLQKYHKIADSAVIGIPDQMSGEVVQANIVLQPGEEATQQEIINFCRGRLASYKTPRTIEFHDSLPKSRVGKTLRRKLRKLKN